MNDEQIFNMLKDLVEDIDYDIYKEMFEWEDTSSEDLARIVKKHLKAANVAVEG